MYFVSVAFLMGSWGCSYKPSYLQRSESAQVSDRWKVRTIDPSRLSPDEAAALEKMGSPQYIRFYRKLDPDRERVYAWVYTEPVRLISFIDGKQVGYVVVDDDPSPLNEHQKKRLFWGSVATATVVGLGLLYYFIVRK
ncbi:MAG: hypothetical protein ABSB32_13155 [Thermodesulfobacteriota bacterium]